MTGTPVPSEAPDSVVAVDPADGTIWSIDEAFLRSNWSCIWDAGCPGIGDESAPDLGLGCCSVGADLLDDDEARRIAAHAAFCEPELFQHHAEAAAGGVFADTERRATRVVDGACIFLNRPGFAGGHGCALHLAALADGESPLDTKPAVCWQLPLRVDRSTDPDGTAHASLRRWRRSDWGPDGTTMAWCCTEESAAYAGAEPVIASLATEIAALVGPEVIVQIRRALGA